MAPPFQSKIAEICVMALRQGGVCKFPGGD